MNVFDGRKAVIFDMDGLLIDSEPLWQEAGKELLAMYGRTLTDDMYAQTTGLRTKEWLQHWFHHFALEDEDKEVAEHRIINQVVNAVSQRGKPMPGVPYILDFFGKRGYKIGLATSSPMRLAEVVTEKLSMAGHFHAVVSAEHLHLGKPHPEVYLNCAASLAVEPRFVLCFEDSFNGLIAAKAAKMKCVVVPAPHHYHFQGWGAADLKLASLEHFSEEHLQKISL
jgi:sugar-phosphatase